jgi:hypothetical protein
MIESNEAEAACMTSYVTALTIYNILIIILNTISDLSFTKPTLARNSLDKESLSTPLVRLV